MRDPRVDELAARVAALEASLSERDRLVDLLVSQQTSFQKVADQYTEGLERARDTIKQLEVRQADAQPTFSQTPLYASEEEEDLEARLMAGSIDPEAYKAALRELEQAGLPLNVQVD